MFSHLFLLLIRWQTSPPFRAALECRVQFSVSLLTSPEKTDTCLALLQAMDIPQGFEDIGRNPVCLCVCSRARLYVSAAFQTSNDTK